MELGGWLPADSEPRRHQAVSGSTRLNMLAASSCGDGTKRLAAGSTGRGRCLWKFTPWIGKFTSASSHGKVKAGGRLPAPAALHEESTRAPDISLVALYAVIRMKSVENCRTFSSWRPPSILPSPCKCQTGDEEDVMRLRVDNLKDVCRVYLILTQRLLEQDWISRLVHLAGFLLKRVRGLQ